MQKFTAKIVYLFIFIGVISFAVVVFSVVWIFIDHPSKTYRYGQFRVQEFQKTAAMGENGNSIWCEVEMHKKSSWFGLSMYETYHPPKEWKKIKFCLPSPDPSIPVMVLRVYDGSTKDQPRDYALVQQNDDDYLFEIGGYMDSQYWFSQDGKKLIVSQHDYATTDANSKITILDIASGKDQAIVAPMIRIRLADVSPDYQQLLTIKQNSSEQKNIDGDVTVTVQSLTNQAVTQSFNIRYTDYSWLPDNGEVDQYVPAAESHTDYIIRALILPKLTWERRSDGVYVLLIPAPDTH